MLADPNSTWQAADTSVLLFGFIIGTVGLLLTLGLLGVSMLEHRRRCEKDTVTDTTPLLEANEEEKTSARPRWRVIFLIFMGSSPLACCVLVGESLGNVLFAMVAMHWICMLVLPATYYAIRSHEEEAFAGPTIVFYKNLWDESLAQAGLKFFRGSLIGMPIFLFLVSGYLVMRCKTFGWDLCMRNFSNPLEQSGFAPHSLPFRVLSALYFTFWNPVIEEFFWRVFLHREMSSEIGHQRKADPEIEQGPWHQLWGDIVEVLLSWPVQGTSRSSAAVCWGVSFMYASYHTWPMKVVFLFNHVWWLHIIIGFLFLACLGRFFIVLRESPNFGLASAYAVHAWIDAAFALLCMFEIHPGHNRSTWDLVSSLSR